jgi:hypothetical protein
MEYCTIHFVQEQYKLRDISYKAELIPPAMFPKETSGGFVLCIALPQFPCQ